MIVKTLDQIPRLYHFTDRRNLESIRSQGGLHPLSDLVTRGVKVPAPGGNQWSRDADELKGMGHYVHLCFRSNHPMEYLARQDGRIGDSIFLEIHASVMQFPDVMFTPDVSNKAGVQAVPIAQSPKRSNSSTSKCFTPGRTGRIKQFNNVSSRLRNMKFSCPATSRLRI